jgi:hypothetical protein
MQPSSSPARIARRSPGVLVDIIVPVLWRSHTAGPFMAALAATGELDRVLVTVAACHADVGALRSWAPHNVQLVKIDDGRPTFAQKVNDVYRRTEAPWMLLVGDDVEFKPGWLDAALTVQRETDAQVIGTNDGGLQARSEMSPHPLIARSYVDWLGASLDGPKLVAHEGYRHNYVDREILMVAQRRGLYAFARESWIRHLHHGIGTAPVDSTYEVGTRHLQDDKTLWRQRERLPLPELAAGAG